jgi:hypothetical protein
MSDSALRDSDSRIRFISPALWPWVLLVYFLVGVAASVLLDQGQRMLIRAGASPQAGTVFVVITVNVLLPGLIILTALWHPRWLLAIPGALLALGGYTIAKMLLLDCQFWTWKPALVGQALHPIVLVACIVGGLFAMLACVVVSGRRRVGLADKRLRCKKCEYLLVGVSTGVCPECGAAIVRSRFDD